jgi:hypothetical protein
MRSSRLIILFAAAALPLGACSSGSPELEATTHTPSPTATETTSPSPTPSLTPSPIASEPTASGPPVGNPCSTPGASAEGLPAIDFNRYASICLGMSFAEASASMPGLPLAGEGACPWYAEVLSVSDPGLYVAAVTHPENAGGEIFLFRMNWLGDPSSAASFDAPTTQEGVSVGSTTAQVKLAYPKATPVTLEDPSRGSRNQLVVAGAGGTALVFDVTSGHVDTVYWGTGITGGAVGEWCAL